MTSDPVGEPTLTYARTLGITPKGGTGLSFGHLRVQRVWGVKTHKGNSGKCGAIDKQARLRMNMVTKDSPTRQQPPRPFLAEGKPDTQMRVALRPAVSGPWLRAHGFTPNRSGRPACTALVLQVQFLGRGGWAVKIYQACLGRYMRASRQMETCW